ncbi:hypothetical protein AMATHDRAFT_71833 [Amanita thiersii Skay4041]|uniref:glutaminase n=1 Tax=Amanita thiersii Skay4041 TaxID=703135 RepID=A0A2A9N684_9AGAR|nr:hypothetical protein AMATHDRAFT_71833 [Amanita thiersii Skay4041]
MPQSDAPRVVVIGVLALQGAFIEHQLILQQIKFDRNVSVIQVRTKVQLEECEALIIPGGESTTMGLLAKRTGLLEPLRQFVKQKPVWGTCAGAILLSECLHGPTEKKGGQDLLHAMPIRIARNGFGSQLESFEVDLDVEHLRNPEKPFTGIFIRAPIIHEILNPQDPSIKAVAKLPLSRLPFNPSLNNHDTSSIVAYRQGRHFLTTFHPELTDDFRFHQYFVEECVFPHVA